MFYSAFALNISEEPNVGFKHTNELHKLQKETDSPRNHPNPDPTFLNSADYEAKLLATQGFKINENIWSYNVDIGDIPVLEETKYKTQTNLMHTLECGREHDEVVVLVHGFGGTSLFWWKVMSQLSQYCHVYAVDQFGTGQSSRPEFDFDSQEKTVKFFCEALEAWRVKLKIEDFTLMGHSFGGYTVAQYFLNYSPPIKKLYLLSPGGFTEKDLKDMMSDMKEKFSMSSLFQNIVRFVFFLLEDVQFNPFQLMNLFNRKTGLNGFFSGNRLRMNSQESSIITEYYVLCSEANWCSDAALGKFLSYGRYSKKPLVSEFNQFHKRNQRRNSIIHFDTPIEVIYGQNDWMDKEHSQEEMNKFGLADKFQMTYSIINDCGHQIIFQQPAEIAKKIVEGLGLQFEEKEVENLLDENHNIKKK